MDHLNKETIDICMRNIIDFYDSDKDNRWISSEYLVQFIPKTLDPQIVVNRLEGLGLIETKRGSKCGIFLTPSGYSYFERDAELKKKDRKESLKFWFPFILSIIALIKSFTS